MIRLKQKVKPGGTKLLLNDPDIKTYFEQLHRPFVIFTSGKASDKFALTCPNFYITKLLFKISTVIHQEKHS